MTRVAPVHFCDVLQTASLADYCDAQEKRKVIVTDQTVSALYLDKIQALFRQPADVLTIPPGEASKSRETKASLEDALFRLGCGRDTLLIALGGGVVTDLVGFIAATYCRGVPVVYVPTTLLAMVDASLGGKTGINAGMGKNLLGTFTQPLAIFIDQQFLKTLPKSEYLGAMSEMIKHASIASEPDFSLIEQNFDAILLREPEILSRLIQSSCDIKMAIVERDQYEKGQRVILNFGHTVAHALEWATHYTLSHGQAVAYGLLAESWIAHDLKYLSDAHYTRLYTLLLRLIQCYGHAPSVARDRFLSALQRDKKNRAGAIRCVLLQEMGVVRRCGSGEHAQPVAIEQFERALDYLAHCQVMTVL